MKHLKWVVLAAVGLLLVYWWNSTRLVIPPEELNKPVDEIVSVDWVLGNSQGLIKVIEYSDFQCPACRQFEAVGHDLTEMYGDRVGFAYRHFPLRQVFAQSDLAAQATEAAGKQGKFWEMSEKIFEGQIQWAGNDKARDFFITYARELELDMDRFESDLESREVRILVEADYLSGLAARINATPTFFVNGVRMNNLQGPDDLIARVELALQQATESATIEE
jgi:protein-disulfide isomerase